MQRALPQINPTVQAAWDKSKQNLGAKIPSATHDYIEVQYLCDDCGQYGYAVFDYCDSGKEYFFGAYKSFKNVKNEKKTSMTLLEIAEVCNSIEKGKDDYSVFKYNCKHFAREMYPMIN